MSYSGGDILTFLALLGTGGVLGSWLNEWLRARREDKVRWHVERRAAYERFLTAADNVREAGLDSAEQISNLRTLTDWGNDPIFDLDDILRAADAISDTSAKYAAGKVRTHQQTVTSAQDHIDASLAAMEMLSTPAVVEAAGVARNALRVLVGTAYEYPPHHCGGMPEPLVQSLEQMYAARRVFVSAVRKELGVE